MVTIPTLTTRRLLLRAFLEGDADPLYGILSGTDVLRYFPPGAPPDRETAVRMIARTLQHWQEHGYGLWAVELRATGELMGRGGFQLIPETGETEADILLGAPFWGRGYATECIETGLRYAAGNLAAKEIVGIIHPENAASRRLLEKLGMRLAGPARYFDMDCERYVLTRAELLARYALEQSAGGPGPP